MAQVITFEDYRPAPRYDGEIWTEAELYEGAAVDGPWTLIDTFTLSPPDADPENPAYRDFTTELASDTPDLWYYILFLDATGDESQATTPVQNVAADATLTYGSVSELFRILKIRQPSAEQETAAERVLLAAAGEINSEIDLADGSSLSAWKLALASEVCLRRAAELWALEEVRFNVVGIGTDLGPTHLSRDTWAKYALDLAPLKEQWGIA